MGVPEWMEEQRDQETRHWNDWDVDTQALADEEIKHLRYDEDGNRYSDAI